MHYILQASSIYLLDAQVCRVQLKVRSPGGRPGILQLVEAAGQLIHVFRHGLDYAFIP